MTADRESIPTDEEFERASQHLAKLTRLDAAIRERVLSLFGGSNSFHDFRIFSASPRYDAYVFMRHDRDLTTRNAEVLRDQVFEAVMEFLEAHGLGPRDAITLRVEIDSHERIQREFNGDYYKRFR